MGSHHDTMIGRGELHPLLGWLRTSNLSVRKSAWGEL